MIFLLNKRSAIAFCLLLLGLLMVSPVLTAQEESQRLEPPDIPVGNEYDFSRFGEGIDLDDNELVVGAPGLEPEAVYVFERKDGEWVHVAKLLSPVEEDVGFGTRVAFDEDIVAISAPQADVEGIEGAGAIYIYERGADNSEWEFRERLTAENPITEAYFGNELVADRGRLAVLAPRANATAYLFEYDPGTESWNEVLESAGTQREESRRSEIDLSGETLVHRVYRQSGEHTVLMYERVGSEWHFTREFTAPTGINAVGIDGDVLAVGETGASSYSPPRGEGMVHIYERVDGQWTHVASVQHEAVPTYQFASRVAVGEGLVAGGERPENGGIDIFGKDASGEWIYLTSVHAGTSRFSYYRLDLSANAIATSNPVHFPHVKVTNLSNVIPDTDDTGDDTGDGDAGDGDTGGDDTGGDDTGDGDTGDGDTGDGDTGDGDTGGDDSGTDDPGGDDGQGVGGGDDNTGGGDEGNDETGGDEGDDNTGGGGDEGETDDGETGDTGDSDEGETGGETGDSDNTPPPSSGSGGGLFAWLLPLLIGSIPFVRNRSNATSFINQAGKQ